MCVYSICSPTSRQLYGLVRRTCGLPYTVFFTGSFSWPWHPVLISQYSLVKGCTRGFEAKVQLVAACT